MSFSNGGQANEKNYVTQTESGYRLIGSRVSLEQVYGAVTYYLAHKGEIDVQLRRNREKFDALLEQSRASHPLLYRHLETADEVFS